MWWSWLIVAAAMGSGFSGLTRLGVRPESAQRMAITVVLVALGLAGVHWSHHRHAQQALLDWQARASQSTQRALAHIEQQRLLAQRKAQAHDRAPLIRERLLIAAWAGEEGMYAGRLDYEAHCARCHAADGAGLPPPVDGPSILDLEDWEPDAIEALLVEHPSSDDVRSGSALTDEVREDIAAFVWAAFRDPLPAPAEQ